MKRLGVRASRSDASVNNRTTDAFRPESNGTVRACDVRRELETSGNEAVFATADAEYHGRRTPALSTAFDRGNSSVAALYRPELRLLRNG